MRKACAIALLILSLAGCGGGGHERFFPSEPAARDALRQVLEQWQRGEAPAGIPTDTVRIEPVDSHRKPGQRVLQFEILGEVSGGGPKVFVVQLGLEQPREDQTARFIVLGQDPLWVFREEDYEMITHWDHQRMTKKKGARSE
jgi:predicted small lipoprotein YifL